MRESACPLPEKRAHTLTNRREIKEKKIALLRGKSRDRSYVNAFTLLELIIAISIGTVIILFVAFAVRMGFFQVERGSKWLEKRYRDNSAVFFFHQQVTSMRDESVNKEIIFNGDPERVVFVTPLSLERSYAMGLMTVYYYIEEGNDGVSLKYKEKRFVPGKNMSSFKDLNTLTFNDREAVEILNGYDEISFEYLASQGEKDTASSDSDHEWKGKWTDNRLPKAVKVVVIKNGKRQESIVPVMVSY